MASVKPVPCASVREFLPSAGLFFLAKAGKGVYAPDCICLLHIERIQLRKVSGRYECI